MTIKFDSFISADGPRLYSANLQPLIQSLLSTLADIDFAYESDIDVVQNSTTDEVLKRKVLGKLHDQHCERRKPYLRQLSALEGS